VVKKNIKNEQNPTYLAVKYFAIHKAILRYLAKCGWLTPIILATWEVEIRRIEV
jgi:hypothetical protein